MKHSIIYIPVRSPVCDFTAAALQDRGVTVTDRPAPDVTHLLLPVPSFESSGRVRGGLILEHLLGELPDSVTVIGGNLNHPILNSYTKLDLLQDPLYLAENAAITADCAMRIAASKLPTVFQSCPILVIGWGRIGKCLSALLQSMGADVTVAARKDTDRAMLRALRYRADSIESIRNSLSRYRVIFNTVPSMILNEDTMTQCRRDSICIDLASSPGLEGSGVITARGLPGKDTPEASGLLIAKTIIRLLKEGGHSS